MDPSGGGSGGGGGGGSGVPFGRGEDVLKDGTFPDGSKLKVFVPFFLKDFGRKVSPPQVPGHYRTTGEIPPGWKEPLRQPPPPLDPDSIPFDLDRYNQQVQSSGGYDVDNMRRLRSLGLIAPLSDPDLQRCYQQYEEYPLFAIEQHNKGRKEGAKLKLVKLLKVATQCSCHPRIFVTFEAKDDSDDGDGDTKIYQARIDIHPPRLVLGEFREKPHQQQTPAANIPIDDQSFAFGPIRWGTP